ncbi:MAG: hypothetical protein RLW62_02385 [Gammaproteobacteria bacterium]
MSVRIHAMSPLPSALENDALARYEAAYRNHHDAWAEVLNRNVEAIRRGSYSLHWLDTTQARWGKRARPSSRGMTYADINRIRGYGDLPAQATWLNFARVVRCASPIATRCP